MSRQKVAGSRGDRALSAIKRYVGSGACYQRFPRMSLLGISVNRANYCNPLPLSLNFWPVSKGYNFSTRHKQRAEKESTWAGRAAAKTKAKKGLWARQR